MMIDMPGIMAVGALGLAYYALRLRPAWEASDAAHEKAVRLTRQTRTILGPSA